VLDCIFLIVNYISLLGGASLDLAASDYCYYCCCYDYYLLLLLSLVNSVGSKVDIVFLNTVTGKDGFSTNPLTRLSKSSVIAVSYFFIIVFGKFPPIAELKSLSCFPAAIELFIGEAFDIVSLIVSNVFYLPSSVPGLEVVGKINSNSLPTPRSLVDF